VQQNSGKWRFKYYFTLRDTLLNGDLCNVGAIGPQCVKLAC